MKKKPNLGVKLVEQLALPFIRISRQPEQSGPSWVLIDVVLLAVGGASAGVRLDAEDSCCSTVCMDDAYKLLRKGSKTAGTMVGRQQNELEAAK